MANWKQYQRGITQKAVDVLVVLATLPYYRFYEFNTRGPIQKIARCRSHSADFSILYISIACAILLGAVIGTFSWNNVDTAYWLTRACWYLTLLLAILGILLSAQQVTVLNFLGEIPDFDEENAEAIVDHYLPLLVTGARHQANQPEAQSRKIYSGTSTPNKRMVFVWQCPIMFMSYSASLFLLGLTILVITPLIRLSENGWTGDATVAIIYLGAGAALAVIFVFSAFWVYHYLDIDVDTALGANSTTKRAPVDEHRPEVPRQERLQRTDEAQRRVDSFPFGQYQAQNTLQPLMTKPSGATAEPLSVRRVVSME